MRLRRARASLAQAPLVRLGLRRMEYVALVSCIGQTSLVILVGPLRLRHHRAIRGNPLPAPGMRGVALTTPDDIHPRNPLITSPSGYLRTSYRSMPPPNRIPPSPLRSRRA